MISRLQFEPNKYNSLLSKVPSIEDAYRNLNRGSPDTILRNIAIIRGQLEVVDDPLAKEMIVDLNAMQETVQAGLKEIERREQDSPQQRTMKSGIAAAKKAGTFYRPGEGN